MRWLIRIVVALLLLFGLAFGIGWSLPVDHTATVEGVVEGSPDEVWAVVTDVGAHPEWRPGVESVEHSGEGPTLSWRESGPAGTLPLRVEQWSPPRTLVARIASDDLPFGGSWRYQFEAVGEGRTRVALTENGEVYNPFFRFVSRFVMGHDHQLRTYLEALTARMAGGAG